MLVAEPVVLIMYAKRKYKLQVSWQLCAISALLATVIKGDYSRKNSKFSVVLLKPATTTTYQGLVRLSHSATVARADF